MKRKLRKFLPSLSTCAKLKLWGAVQMTVSLAFILVRYPAWMVSRMSVAGTELQPAYIKAAFGAYAALAILGLVIMIIGIACTRVHYKEAAEAAEAILEKYGNSTDGDTEG